MDNSTVNMPNSVTGYRIRDFGNDKNVSDKPELQLVLLSEYCDKHISVEFTRQSGVKSVLFFYVSKAGCKESGGKEREVNFI